MMGRTSRMCSKVFSLETSCLVWVRAGKALRIEPGANFAMLWEYLIAVFRIIKEKIK